MRRAGDVLGTVRPAWVERAGLPADTKIYCGLHDSNAALLGAKLERIAPPPPPPPAPAPPFDTGFLIVFGVTAAVVGYFVWAKSQGQKT